MDMKKGISPLIAAVILIAFVVAVASVVATFFTDIAGEWGQDIEEAEPVECAMMDIDIMDFNTEVNTSQSANNASLSFRSTGSIMTGVTVNIYGDDVYSGSLDSNSTPFADYNGTVEEGLTVTTDLVNEGVISEENIVDVSAGDTVEVVSLDCTGVTEEYTVEEGDITNVTES